MTLLWLPLLGVSALTGFAFFVTSLRRWPQLSAVYISANVLIAWELPFPPALVNVGGNSVFFLDILCAAFLIISTTRVRQMNHNIGSASWFWFAFGFLLCLSLLRGVGENPFGTTVNEFRSFLYPYAAMTWAMSLDWSPALTRSLIRRFAMTLGWGLVVVAAYHVSHFGIGSTSGFVDAGTGVQQTTRPLVAGQALMLLMCAIVCLWFWRSQMRLALLVSAVLFLCVVIVVQERTVWSVAIIAAIVIFVVGRISTKVTMLLSGLSAASIFGLIATTNVAPDLLSKLGGAASDSGTYDARVTSWLSLIAQSVSQGIDRVIIGAPMGSGFGRFEGADRWVVFAPHNWYLTVYLRVGIVGLSLLLLFLAFVFTRVLRERTHLAALAILIVTITFGWTYSWPWYICLFTGWAIADRSTDPSLSMQTNGPAIISPQRQSGRVSSYEEI
jgi:hypothetical protein